jgi:excisionase family DNA binding protein
MGDICMKEKERRVFTTFQAAEYCHVSPFTVRNWIESEVLPAYRTPGGHRRVLREDLDAFLRKHGMPGGDILEGANKKVLIVDDDKAVTTFVSKVVKEVDDRAEIATALNGFTAGSLVKSFRPQVVILDLKMPGLDGFEVCKMIKTDPSSSDTTVLGITGYHTAANAKKFANCGGWQLLKKPLDVDRLKNAISEALSIHWSARKGRRS